jgi:uncharacterized membrane protein YfcA
MFGVGGGIVMVPLLIWLGRLDQRRAAATSLAAIIPTALVGAAGYGFNGRLEIGPAAVIAAGAMAGAWAGARLLRTIKLATLNWVFVGLIAATAVAMAFFQPQRGPAPAMGAAAWAGLAALGLAMGLAAGLFGIGGGIIAVPALMAIFGFSDLAARGTSLLVMVPSAVAGSITNHQGGLVAWRPAMATGLTAAAAALAGGGLAVLIAPRAGNLLFAGLLAVTAVQLSIRAARAARAARAGS